MTIDPIWVSGATKEERRRNKLEKAKKRANFCVKYDLAYDGGGSSWTGYYRRYWVARVAAFWNLHFSSWGGSAVLYPYPLPEPPPKKRKGIFRGR